MIQRESEAIDELVAHLSQRTRCRQDLTLAVGMAYGWRPWRDSSC